MGSVDVLSELGLELKERFGEKKRVLSFTDYFELFWKAPRHHSRNAARYLLDTFDFYGTEELSRPWGTETRYKLFDAPFDGGRDQLVGQERAQQAFYRGLRNFTREGRVKRLILLHGPNGSAKSTFISCLSRALVDYSKRDEGALYTFRWVFPTQRVGKGRFGFTPGSGRDTEKVTTYAYLEDDQLDARLGTELRDHPLLLIPKKRRRDLLLKRLEEVGELEEFTQSDYMFNGDLSPRNRQIFEALLSSYNGDFNRVMAHVQVERFFISRRYRQGAVTVEPQMHVDAQVRQITADKSLERLPPSLHSTTLFEPMGDLVDANRGIIEYNDLLKRPVDAFKYLLSTCEKGTVALPNCILYLDLVLVGSSNETHLAAFKEYPDFQSFKGRMELIRASYIRSYLVEQGIYESQISESSVRKHIAPHAFRVAALWAVLTRLHRPEPKAYDEPLQELIGKLTPLDKAEMYATGRLPKWVSLERRRDLASALSDLYDETEGEAVYEGVLGASPREMQTILLNAAQDSHFSCLSPVAIFAELERLVKDRTVYEFLKLDPEGGYHDHNQFIADVRQVYRDLVDAELRDAMGLVGESQYLDLFTRYVDHVIHTVKGEKIWNPVTKSHEDPDERFMAEVEGVFGVKEDAARFRGGLISDIGAFRIDNPEAEVDYPTIFPKLFDAIRDSYFEKQSETVSRFREQMLQLLSGEPDELKRAERERAEECLATLIEKYGYCEHCARDALQFLHASTR